MALFTTIATPIGELVLTGEEAPNTRGGVMLRSVSFGGVRGEGIRAPQAFADVERQFGEYFAGERTAFDLDLDGGGTEFQKRVWTELDGIPAGSTTTYGEIAKRVGAPRDRIRAVAAAIGANPLVIVRPCHRVLGADGSLTGYAGGIERKQFLLAHEGALQPLFT